MKEYKKHKFKFNPYLEKLYQSDEPLIIYKVDQGYDIYTHFSKKVILTNKNISKFFNYFNKKNYRKETDMMVGFFGYELLCNLIGLKTSNQKKSNFYKGIFYKPETVIKIRDKIKIVSKFKQKKLKNSFQKTQVSSPFKMNIKFPKYQKIFNYFSKKIREGETYQIKICTKYKNKSLINPLNFFWKLMKVNASPESFMIKDKDYSIVSCSPETLIYKKGSNIFTKPIAGTLKKLNGLNKHKALKFFKNNIKETKEHNMIVDMERNDLSKICKPGTVVIKKKKNM